MTCTQPRCKRTAVSGMRKCEHCREGERQRSRRYRAAKGVQARHAVGLYSTPCEHCYDPRHCRAHCPDLVMEVRV